MAKEIGSMTFEELQAEMKSIQQRMHDLKDQRVQEVKQQIIDLAASIGETPESLFGMRPGPAGKRRASARYRHPEDPSLTWSGRGRLPGWLKSLEDQGLSRDEFLIERQLSDSKTD